MTRLNRILLAVLVLILGGSIILYRGGYLNLPSASDLSLPTPAARGAAPEFTGIEGWLNSGPLKMSELRGKVVLVDFWTYSCINCQRTLPYLRSWWDKYKDKGLVIVGVHSPEFNFEKVPANVRAAVQRYHVAYPVALDNRMLTWNAYQNQFWPHKYLVDKKGKIRYDHIGEGGYEETERTIQRLLSEGGPAVTGELTKESPVPISGAQTAETYAGFDRGILGNPEGYKPYKPFTYSDAGKYEDGKVYLQGTWLATAENLGHARVTKSLEDHMALRYSAKDVYVVTAGDSKVPYRVYVTLDGKPLGRADAGSDVRFDPTGRAYVEVSLATLYNVVSTPAFGTHTLIMASDSDRFAVFAFTFGS